METKIRRKHEFKKSQFIKTLAVRRHLASSGKTISELAVEAGVPWSRFKEWYWKNKFPKPILERLGIKARNSSARRSEKPETAAQGVPKNQKQQRKAFRKTVHSTPAMSVASTLMRSSHSAPL